MLLLIRRVVREPLWLTAALWPLVMLAPFVPGIPRPAPGGGSWWRQELTLASLLCLTIVLLIRRARFGAAHSLRIPRQEIFLITPLVLFVLWSAASMSWAVSPVMALHHTMVWVGYLFFFLLMRRVAERPRLLRTSFITLASVVWCFGVASTAEFWTASAMQYWGDRSLLFRNFIGLGEPLAAAVPLFTALALGVRHRRTAVWCGATGIMAWLVVLQTLERAPFIGASVALAALAVGALTLPQFRKRGVIRAGVLFAAFAAATALQTLPSFSEQQVSVLTRLSPAAATVEAGVKSSNNARLLLWGAGIEMLRAHPIAGTGANNYEAVYPEARARFAAKYPDSPLVEVNEDRLVQRAHNEYVQMLAELGAVGFGLFVTFSVMLMWLACRALRAARQTPLVPGAVAGMAAFAISSGASSMSYRWLGSGLMFFCAAAIVTRFASGDSTGPQNDAPVVSFAPTATRAAGAIAFGFCLLMFACMGAQGISVALHGAAQASATPQNAARLFDAALLWNPYDASANFNYGLYLYYRGDDSAEKAARHLRYATRRGFNASESYAYLAAAEAAAGDLRAAEKTLAYATSVYPRSVFLRVRHAVALAEVGDIEEAGGEYRAAASLDTRAARGWWHLINSGRKGARAAAHNDPSIPMAGALHPENCIYVAVAEHARRPPNLPHNGREVLRAVAEH